MKVAKKYFIVVTYHSICRYTISKLRPTSFQRLTVESFASYLHRAFLLSMRVCQCNTDGNLRYPEICNDNVIKTILIGSILYSNQKKLSFRESKYKNPSTKKPTYEIQFFRKLQAIPQGATGLNKRMKIP